MLLTNISNLKMPEKTLMQKITRGLMLGLLHTNCTESLSKKRWEKRLKMKKDRKREKA